MASSNGTASEAGTSTDIGKQTYTKIPTPEETNTLAESLQVIFMLSYNARKFMYAGDRSTITTGFYRVAKISDEPTGFLGIYRSRDAAKIWGKSWIYAQLDNIDEDLGARLPLWRAGEINRMDERPSPGTWRRMGDERSGWENDSVYRVTDLGRQTGPNHENVTLSVIIEEIILEEYDNEKYETDSENDGAGNDVEAEVPEEGRASAGIVGIQATTA